MCLSFPAKVVAVLGKKIEVEVFGVRKEVFLACEEVSAGDWVLVHGPIAVHVLDTESKDETLRLLEEMRRGATPVDP